MRSGYSPEAQAYVDGVLDGSIPACLWIRLACKRSMEDFERFAAPDSPYRFDPKKARRICKFIGQLRHVKDSIATKAGERIVLLGWQRWILETIFGWVHRDNGLRRFHHVYVECARGNGKSTLASAIGLFCCFAENVGGAQTACAASQKEQAGIVLNDAREMLNAAPEIREQLGLEVRVHEIRQPRTNSRMWALPAKASSVEGLSTNCGILDELHAARGRALHDVLSTGCTKREQSLFLMVTTAGNDSSGVAFEIRSFLEKLLDGEDTSASADAFFCAMYTVDAEDQWDSPDAHRKANPSWGVSVDPRQIAETAALAHQMPSRRAEFRTKHLCEWILNGGDEPFLDPVAVRACYDANLDEKEFLGQTCALGLDLATRKDMTAAVRVFMRKIEGKPHYYAFAKTWLPEKTMKDAANASYRGWEIGGHINVTSGARTDLDIVEAEILSDAQLFKIRDVTFDALQANMLVGHLEKAGIVCPEMPQFAKYMTIGMRFLDDIVAGGQLHFRSPVLRWCLLNLQARTAGAALIWPVRPKNLELKIDAGVALLFALRSAAVSPLDEAPADCVYNHRGILLLEDLPLAERTKFESTRQEMEI
ncbi:MAG: terminase large subunit [Candidatus Acidiferrum sp.]